VHGWPGTPPTRKRKFAALPESLALRRTGKASKVAKRRGKSSTVISEACVARAIARPSGSSVTCTYLLALRPDASQDGLRAASRAMASLYFPAGCREFCSLDPPTASGAGNPPGQEDGHNPAVASIEMWPRRQACCLTQ
jgi:hypothetical protein